MFLVSDTLLFNLKHFQWRVQGHLGIRPHPRCMNKYIYIEKVYAYIKHIQRNSTF